MAHFAELDANNVVLRVIVVGNPDTADANGVEKEYIGAAFCERLLGGTWKQTSYNGNIRKNYAGIGYTYDAGLDAFITPQPYPSWALDANAAGKLRCQSPTTVRCTVGTSRPLAGQKLKEWSNGFYRNAIFV
jgi:hypothetical protein